MLLIRHSLTQKTYEVSGVARKPATSDLLQGEALRYRASTSTTQLHNARCSCVGCRGVDWRDYLHQVFQTGSSNTYQTTLQPIPKSMAAWELLEKSVGSKAILLVLVYSICYSCCNGQLHWSYLGSSHTCWFTCCSHLQDWVLCIAPWCHLPPYSIPLESRLGYHGQVASRGGKKMMSTETTHKLLYTSPRPLTSSTSKIGSSESVFSVVPVMNRGVTKSRTTASLAFTKNCAQSSLSIWVLGCVSLA